MSSKRALSYVTCAVLTLATACGGSSDKSTGPSDNSSGTTATAADVSGMIQALSAIGAFSFSPTAFTGAPDVPGLAAQTSSNYPFDVTTNCPGGGTIRVNGNYSYSLSGQSYTYNGTMTDTFNGCKATGNGVLYTFTNSSWTATFSMNYNLNAGTYTYSLHETGNLRWASTAKAGSTCAIDVTVAVSYGGANSTPTYQYSGTYCGISVTA